MLKTTRDQWYYMKDNCSKNLLLSSLVGFYDDPRNLHQLLPILNQTSPMSLRVIDYFCTTYSKVKNVYMNNLNIHENYKIQLKSYKKANFDCFCREEKVKLVIQDYEIHTSLAQLSFMRWFIETAVIDYVSSNYEAIERDMMQVFASRQKLKKDNKLPKNAKTSSPVTKSISKRQGSIQMQFKWERRIFFLFFHVWTTWKKRSLRSIGKR